MSSSKKWWVGLMLATASLLVGIALLWRPAPPSPFPGQAEKPAPAPAQAIARMEARAAETARQRLTQIPEPAIPRTVGGFSREAVGGVLGGYREMLAVQGLYNQKATRERIVTRILESPQGAEIAAKTLTDATFAQEAFGEFQAEARFYSIELLKEGARRGDDRLLLRSTDYVAQQLSRLADGTRPLDKGMSTDLRDLVLAVIDVKGVESFSKGDTGLVRAMGYTPRMSPQVKTIYDDVLFMRLKRQFGRERAASMTAALLES